MTYEIRRARVEGYAYCVNKLRQNVGLETWIWRQIMTSHTAHSKYKWPPCATQWTPHKFSAYATESSMFNNFFGSVSTLPNVDLSLPPFAPKTDARIPQIYMESLDIFHVLKRLDPSKSKGLLSTKPLAYIMLWTPNYTVSSALSWLSPLHNALLLGH